MGLYDGMLNRDIWERYPDRAEAVALEAIENGGFGQDWIKRHVSNYEGQLMAIQRGWVDFKPYSEKSSFGGYHINETGLQALRKAGKSVPHFLSVIDSWHGSASTYCAYEKTYKGKPVLQLFAKSIPKGTTLAMDPLLSVENVRELRDYLNDFLDRFELEEV